MIFFLICTTKSLFFCLYGYIVFVLCPSSTHIFFNIVIRALNARTMYMSHFKTLLARDTLYFLKNLLVLLYTYIYLRIEACPEARLFILKTHLNLMS
jgi:hypothetical protein